MGSYQAKDHLILDLEFLSNSSGPKESYEPAINELMQKTRALYSHDNGCQSGNEKLLSMSNSKWDR